MLDLTKERILVTGGHGFLGKHVVAKLRAMGCVVEAPTHDECNLRDPEETDYALPGHAGVVIHLAAECGGIGANVADPIGMLVNNLQMSRNIVDYCHRYKAKLVAVGSVCSYPSNTPVPFKESDLWNGYPEPTNAPYGIAKRVLWSLMDAYHRQYGLKCAYLIPANLYGPGDNFDLETSHVIPAMIRKFVEAGEGGFVELWGDGTPTRDFLYVEDCADAIIRAAERIESPEPINIGTGKSCSMLYLACAIVGLLGYGCAMSWDQNKPNGQMQRRLDCGRAKELMDWEPKTDFVDGLEETIAWYRANREAVGV